MAEMEAEYGKEFGSQNQPNYIKRQSANKPSLQLTTTSVNKGLLCNFIYQKSY